MVINMGKTKGIGKIVKRIILLIIIFLMLIVVGFLMFVLMGKDKTLQLSTGNTPISVAEDGVYTGSYRGFRWSNTVEVTVKDHEIKGIRILKAQVFAKQETIDSMTQRILSAQSTEVDVVSGATADSKAYLKAVENALNKPKAQ